MTRPRPCYVEWRDSALLHGQYDRSEAPRVSTMRTVGFLLRKTRTALYVAQDLCPSGQARGFLTIPRFAITSWRYL